MNSAVLVKVSCLDTVIHQPFKHGAFILIGDCIKIFMVPYCLCCVIETTPPLALANIQITIALQETIKSYELPVTVQTKNTID